MSAQTTHSTPPKPKGDLLVVGAVQGADRETGKVTAKVIIRDETGQEFSFVTTVHHSALTPFYR